MKLFKFFAVIAVGFLTACGSSESTATSSCDFPYELRIYRDSGGVVTQSISYYEGGPQHILSTGDEALTVIPSCPGAGTQLLSFTLKTTNFFNSTVGDHIVALSKGTVDLSIPRYKARGIIFSPDNGVRGELLRRDGGSITNVCQDSPTVSNGAPCTPGMPYVNPMVFDDAYGQTYNVQLEAVEGNIAYTVTKSTGGHFRKEWYESYTHEMLTGNQLGFAVLCRGTCHDKVFDVRFKNLYGGWF